MAVPFLWYRDKQTLRIGDVCRYRVRYTETDPTRTEIYLRVKNMEKTGLRAIHLLNGPFILYCHVVPCNYNHTRNFVPENPRANREVVFRNSIKPGQTFNVKLYLNENSLAQANEDGSRTYEWNCDIISQIVLNRRAVLVFDFMIGDDLPNMRRLNRSVLTQLSKGEFVSPEFEEDDTGLCSEPTKAGLEISRSMTDDIWAVAPKFPEQPVHLVIVTHGIFSNLTADMLYLRDELSSVDDNIVILGYRDNAGRTEKGVHRLGVGVSTYVTDTIETLSKDYEIGAISFVGHSLGGPVQLYALKHILLSKGTDYFSKKKIELRHFVCLASPMLGILSEMSLWISWFLDLGTLGKTGRDLTLLKKLPTIMVGKEDVTNRDSYRPILETLPDEPVQTLLQQFSLRTVYANAVHDGIVPLRTSALLYLDWEALGDVNALKHEEQVSELHSRLLTQTNSSGHDVGEIPVDDKSSIADKYSNFLAQNFNIGSDSVSESTGLTGKDGKRKKLSKRVKKYAKINAKGSDSWTAGDDDEAVDVGGEGVLGDIIIPPKASAVESAINSMICPIPSENYITIPSRRKPVIFHDKYYHFSSIPQEELHLTGGLRKFFHYSDWRMDKQVRIARKYHAPELSWRKVLVFLPPDAHNNIVVRRRFANGYGWGVIDHLRDAVFGEPKILAKM